MNVGFKPTRGSAERFVVIGQLFGTEMLQTHEGFG